MAPPAARSVGQERPGPQPRNPGVCSLRPAGWARGLALSLVPGHRAEPTAAGRAQAGSEVLHHQTWPLPTKHAAPAFVPPAADLASPAPPLWAPCQPHRPGRKRRPQICPHPGTHSTSGVRWARLACTPISGACLQRLSRDPTGWLRVVCAQFWSMPFCWAQPALNEQPPRARPKPNTADSLIFQLIFIEHWPYAKTIKYFIYFIFLQQISMVDRTINPIYLSLILQKLTGKAETCSYNIACIGF